MPGELSRIQKLAWRVVWLDRHRRKLAIGCAVLLSPLLLERIARLLGADWPRFHATLLSLMVGVVVWWLCEVALIWITAIWETECAALMRDRGLPRAILRKHGPAPRA